MVGQNKQNGFTIVELLIVIVVIGILAAITLVAYTGVQANARDAQRKSDISAITKALELYYADKGVYPPGSGSTTINSSWSTTIDPSSWSNLATHLQPYMASLPTDPKNTPGVDHRLAANVDAYGYSYFSNTGPGVTYCGVQTQQMYILVHEFENTADYNTYSGECTTNPLQYAGSNVRIVK